MKDIVICVAFAFCSIGIFSYADAAGVDVNGKGSGGVREKAGKPEGRKVCKQVCEEGEDEVTAKGMDIEVRI